MSKLVCKLQRHMQEQQSVVEGRVVECREQHARQSAARRGQRPGAGTL